MANVLKENVIHKDFDVVLSARTIAVANMHATVLHALQDDYTANLPADDAAGRRKDHRAGAFNMDVTASPTVPLPLHFPYHSRRQSFGADRSMVSGMTFTSIFKYLSSNCRGWKVAMS